MKEFLEQPTKRANLGTDLETGQKVIAPELPRERFFVLLLRAGGIRVISRPRFVFCAGDVLGRDFRARQIVEKSVISKR
jgi:hypothetical protein